MEKQERRRGQVVVDALVDALDSSDRITEVVEKAGVSKAALHYRRQNTVAVAEAYERFWKRRKGWGPCPMCGKPRHSSRESVRL